MKDVDEPEHVAAWLAITYWDQKFIVNQGGSRDRAYWEFFLKNHPAPSWKVVAIALWRTADYRALEIVMKLYFKCKFIITGTRRHMLRSFPAVLALQSEAIIMGFSIIKLHTLQAGRACFARPLVVLWHITYN